MEDQQNEGALKVIEAPVDCGNAPRKMVIRNLLVALYERDQNAAVNFLREDTQWDVIGSSTLHGLEEIRHWIRSEPPVDELHIATVITHGTDCGADGWVVHPDGSTTSFSHILRFAGHTKTAKIKQLRSYLIATEARLSLIGE